MAKSQQLVVSAPLVVIRNTDGTRQHLYAGTPVPDGVDPEHRDQLLGEGMLAETKLADVEPEPPDVPAKSAPKAEWEAYARSQGAANEDLDGKTKDDLVATYGDQA